MTDDYGMPVRLMAKRGAPPQLLSLRTDALFKRHILGAVHYFSSAVLSGQKPSPADDPFRDSIQLFFLL